MNINLNCEFAELVSDIWRFCIPSPRKRKGAKENDSNTTRESAGPRTGGFPRASLAGLSILAEVRAPAGGASVPRRPRGHAALLGRANLTGLVLGCIEAKFFRTSEVRKVKEKMRKGQILQENMRLKALAEIYTMHILL